MYGLLRIVLHNSYISGLTTQIEAKGHTNNSGDNGAGKTSALRLIPIFYGKEPESLVNTSGGKKSFLDYYLPTKNSLVLFEYEREDGLNCVAMYRHPTQNKVVYRFIKSGYDAAFSVSYIHEKMMNNANVADIFKDIKDGGIYVSKAINTIIGYRSVILQNEAALRRSNQERNNLRREAKEFCLGTSESQSLDIDELASSLLNRDKMLPRLKQMIANTQLGDFGSIQKPMHLQNNALLDDISSMRLFGEYEPDINECINDARLYQSSKEVIDRTARTLKLAIQEGREKLSGYQEKDASYVRKLDEMITAFEAGDVGFSKKIADTQSELQVTTERIESIYSAKEAWDNENMEHKKSEYDNLETFTENRRQAVEQHEALTKQIQDIESEKRDELSRINQRHAENVRKIEFRMSELQNELATKKAEAAEKASELRDERNKAVNELKDSLHQEEIRLNVLKSEHANTLRNMGMSDDEEIQVTRAEERISEVEAKRVVIIGKRDKANEECLSIENNRKKALSVLEEFNAEKIRREDQLNTLIRQRFPEDGTFLSDLKASGTEWSKDIGRLIRPELLQNKHLSPEKIEGSGHTFFGWSVDLEQIELPDFAMDDIALDDKISNLETEISGLNKRISEEEKRVRGIASEIEQHKGIITNLSSAVKEVESDVIGAKAFLKELRQSIQQAIAARKADVQAELDAVERQISSFKADRQKKIDEIEEIFREKIMESKGLYDSNLSKLVEAIAHQQEFKDDQDKQCKADIEVTEARFTERAIKEGADPELIKKASIRVKELTEKCKVVEGYLRLINEYNEWLKISWGKIGEMNAKESALKLSLSTFETERKEFQAEYERKKRELGNQRNDLNRVRNKLTSALNNAEVALNNVSYNELGETTEDRDLTILSEKLATESSTAKALSLQVSKRLKKVYKVFVKFEDSQIAKAWANLDYARQNKSSFEEGSIEYEMEQAGDLNVLISGSVPQIKASLLENVRSFGQSINNYHVNLKQISNRIGRISNELGSAINSNQRIGSISDVNIVLESRIEQFDCWDDLNKFSKEWEEWRSSANAEDLPTDRLVDSLRIANQSLNDARIKNDKASLINLKITMVENGNRREISSDADFNNSSSNGLSYLAICIVFMGMTRYLCPDERIQLAWPIDELAALSPNNISSLFEMMNERNIVMFSAFPSEDPSLLKHFESKNLISLHGVRKIEMKRAKRSIEEIKQRNIARKKTLSESQEEAQV